MIRLLMKRLFLASSLDAHAADKIADPVQAFYDRVASSAYDRCTDKKWFGPCIALGVLFPILKSGETIVDLGVGTGNGATLFNRMGVKVIGLDVSKEMLNSCINKGTCLSIHQHDLKIVPYPVSSKVARAVLSTGVLHFLPDLKPVFSETTRMLNESGYFFFDVLRMISPDPNLKRMVDMRGLQTYLHSHQYIEALLMNCGLKIIGNFSHTLFEESVPCLDRASGQFSYHAYFCQKDPMEA